ncbi:unnamed protein product, partial [Lactuca virosa]
MAASDRKKKDIGCRVVFHVSTSVSARVWMRIPEYVVVCVLGRPEVECVREGDEREKIVVVIGSGPSATDISKEIAMVAKEVHMSSRSPLVNMSKLEKFDNLWQHSKISYVSTDGTLTFQDGLSVVADVILHCT